MGQTKLALTARRESETTLEVVFLPSGATLASPLSWQTAKSGRAALRPVGLCLRWEAIY